MSETTVLDPTWVQMCEADGLDPHARLAARQAVLNHPQALDCTLYRADDNDPDAEEEDLGDARLLFTGHVELPSHWSAAERDEYLDGAAAEDLLSALIECQAAPASKAFFIPDVGDYVACIGSDGQIAMYYLHDYEEDNQGRRCVLIREALDDL